MKEAAFIRQNLERWKRFERLLQREQQSDPDQLAQLFVQVNNDLAYARTFFPESRTKQYLNDVAAHLHLAIYSNRREPLDRLWRFWQYEVPLAISQSLRELKISAVLLVLFAGLGWLSSQYQPDFVRSVLGDAYVNETMDNIQAGDPLAIYKDDHPGEMFGRIFLNNFFVMLRFFALGLFLSIGTVLAMLQNGVMLGVFHHLFYRYGELDIMVQTVFIHGTIEIATMVMSCTAGLCLGNGILLPGSYTRLRAFRMGARRGLKIAIGLVPFIFIAAALEAFVTRFYQVSTGLNLLIILLSLGLVLGYYVLYPLHLRRQGYGADESAEYA